MADLGSLTQRIAGATAGAAVGAVKSTARVATGVAGGILNTVKQGVYSSTGIDRITPRNIAASTLDSMGLGSIVPSVLGGSRNSRAASAASRVADSSSSSKSVEALLRELVNVNSSILDTNREMLNYMKEQTGYLKDANDLTKRKTIGDIEAAREARQPAAGAGIEQATKAPESGGLFGGILKSVKGILGFVGSIGSFLGAFLSGVGSIAAGLFVWMKGLKSIGGIVSSVGAFFGKILSPLSGVFSAIGGFFGKILAFGGRVGGVLAGALEFLAPVGRFLGSIGSLLFKFGKFALTAIPVVGQVIGALLSLERADWAMLFGNIGKIFGDLAEGNFLDALARAAGTFADILLKSVGRIVQNIVEFFGFTDAAASIKKFLDETNLGDLFVEGVRKIVGFFMSFGDMLSNAAKTIGSLVSDTWNFLTSIPSKFVDTLSGLVPDFLKNAFKSLFGSSTSTATAATTAAPAATTNATERTRPMVQELSSRTDANITQQNASATRQPRATTPVLGEPAEERFREKTVQEIASSFVDTLGAEGALQKAKTIYKRLNPTQPTLVTPLSNSLLPSVSPEATASYTSMAAGSRVMATEANSRNNQPIVINTPAAPQSQQGTISAPRTSGAASTAPVLSHIDRTIYGNAYGDGIA
jgi:hypothetical protein